MKIISVSSWSFGQTEAPPPATAEAPPSAVVVESGPVLYDDVDEEEDEEEETCVSAMELLGGDGQFKHTAGVLP